MQPVNSKSLLSFLYSQMEKLDQKEIDVQTAQAQANLAKQANNILTYELKRAELEMKLAEFNVCMNEKVSIRQVESKAFDDSQA